MAAYYSQKLSWSKCHDVFECATLLVPEDYKKPGGRTLHIGVIRKPSSSTHEGSLIINPGGPGASGVTFEVEAADSFSELTDHYDLVSFDPRGVGLSDPVRCLSAPQLDTFINVNPVPTDAAAMAAQIAQAKLIANACFAKNGSYLEHIGTIDAARDMDVLRAALGDKKLTYYGGSYGTYMGALYAELFPTHVRALVLDGALNPAESETDVNRIQAGGFQTDLGDFLAACVHAGNCPLGASTDAAHATLDAEKAQVTAHPLNVNGRSLGAGEFFEGLAAGLYSPSDWQELWNAFGALKSGNGTAVLFFADQLTDRHSDGTYSNLVESNLAINCIDRPSPSKLSDFVSAARTAAATSPDFGTAIEYGSLPCLYWKVPPVQTPHAIHAAGAPPILVIGTTRDPATPYVWAQALSQQLKSGMLLTYNGDGHTAYLRHDSCIDAAVKGYIEDLRSPKPGTTCS